jgi:hypothetical protein
MHVLDDKARYYVFDLIRESMGNMIQSYLVGYNVYYSCSDKGT